MATKRITVRVLGTLALLPTTLCFGALFPLTVKLLAPDPARASRAVSIAYSANTLGAILGSFLTGVVLLPVWGSSVAIQLASGLLLLGACIGMWYLGAFRRRVLLYAVPAMALILVVRFDFANTPS